MLSRRFASRVNPRSFTLLELLIVLAIIGLLLAIVLPVLGRARTRSLTQLCRVCNSKIYASGQAGDACQAATAELNAFDLGCHTRNLAGFSIPKGSNPKDFRAGLQAATERACH